MKAKGFPIVVVITAILLVTALPAPVHAAPACQTGPYSPACTAWQTIKEWWGDVDAVSFDYAPFFTIGGKTIPFEQVASNLMEAGFELVSSTPTEGGLQHDVWKKKTGWKDPCLPPPTQPATRPAPVTIPPGLLSLLLMLLCVILVGALIGGRTLPA